MENKLLLNKHTLIYIDEQMEYLFNNNSLCSKNDSEYVKNNFYGNVCKNLDEFKHDDGLIYMCGDIDTNMKHESLKNKQIIIIDSMSYNQLKEYDNVTHISNGEIPINYYNVGVLFRNYFKDKLYFESIASEHKFQDLTESNKPGTSYRTGIYLTKVTENGDDIDFKLLRCSSNLNGPTDNFRDTDNKIIKSANEIAELFFEQKTELNHVLAQIYNNQMHLNDKNILKERKASIKEHSDKTKDMPENGLIAFTTFYKNYENGYFKNMKYSVSENDIFDFQYKNISVLTKLRFRLKSMVSDVSLKKEFDVLLYPNSMFLISLTTNRLYTHEIIPSSQSINVIPTRLGYVIRCSNTDAKFKNGQTYIKTDKGYVELENETEKELVRLKELYYKENSTDEIVKYNNFLFSMNKGDYEKPIV